MCLLQGCQQPLRPAASTALAAGVSSRRQPPPHEQPPPPVQAVSAETVRIAAMAQRSQQLRAGAVGAAPLRCAVPHRVPVALPLPGTALGLQAGTPLPPAQLLAVAPAVVSPTAAVAAAAAAAAGCADGASGGAAALLGAGRLGSLEAVGRVGSLEAAAPLQQMNATMQQQQVSPTASYLVQQQLQQQVPPDAGFPTQQQQQQMLMQQQYLSAVAAAQQQYGQDPSQYLAALAHQNGEHFSLPDEAQFQRARVSSDLMLLSSFRP